jgi:hypothetical protein
MKKPPEVYFLPRYKKDDPSLGILSMRVESRYVIGFYKSVIVKLGNPDYLNFWWSARECALLVEAAINPNDNSVSLCGYSHSSKNGPSIRNRMLSHAIKALIGEAKEKTRMLRGDYIPELKMIAFRIDM